LPITPLAPSLSMSLVNRYRIRTEEQQMAISAVDGSALTIRSSGPLRVGCGRLLGIAAAAA